MVAAKASPAPSLKRKVKSEDEDEDEGKAGSASGSSGSEADEKKPAAKPVKKAKTTVKKAKEEPVLVARTAVSTLPKAMYIGAHVSSAGGKKGRRRDGVGKD